MAPVNALAIQTTIDAGVVEQVLLKGDLKSLTAAQKIAYYNNVCTSLGLNPLTQPFAYIVLNGKEMLYAKKDATEQLRKLHAISIDPKGFVREVIEGVYVVTAPASMPSGRTDVSTGAVAIDGLKGENRANAMMKAETKAKRRVTLSICGLGMLDETEVDSIPGAKVGSIEGPILQPAKAITLPPGTFQITHAHVGTWGGRIVVVDPAGVETEYPVPDTRCAQLCEAIQQEGVPVTLTLVTGARDKKVKVKAVARWKPAHELTDAELDAEIAAKDAEPPAL